MESPPPSFATRAASLLFVFVLAGCSKEPTSKAHDNAAPIAATAAPPSSGKEAAARPTTSDAAVPAASLRAPPSAAASSRADVRVAAGTGSGGWMPAFTARHVDGDAGKSYLAAMDHCQTKDMMLCSSAQWERACRSIASLGATASWTASWEGEQVAVRGGTDCTTKGTAAGSATQPSGLCCTRAIGIGGSGKNEAFLRVAHADQLAWETALNKRDVKGIEALVASALEFNGNRMLGSEAVQAQKRYWKEHPKMWTFFDTCDASIGRAFNPNGGRMTDQEAVVTDCQTIVALGDKVTVLRTRFGRSRWDVSEESNTTNRVVEVKEHDVARKLTGF